MNMRLLLLLAAPAAGFALGAVSVRKSEPNATGAEKAKGTVLLAGRESSADVNSRVQMNRVLADRKMGNFSRLLAMLRIFDDASPEEMPLLLEQMAKENENTILEELLPEIFIKKWVAKDPLGAVKAAIAGDPSFAGEDWRSIFEEAAKTGSEEAWAEIQGVDQPGKKHEMERCFVEATAEAHPDFALRLLAEGSPDLYSPDLMLTLSKSRLEEVVAFAQKNFETGGYSVMFRVNGLDRLAQFADASDDRAIEKLADYWVRAGEKEAVLLANGLEADLRDIALKRIVENWRISNVEPDKVIAEIIEEPGSKVSDALKFRNLNNSKVSFAERKAIVEQERMVPHGNLADFSGDWLRSDPVAFEQWLSTGDRFEVTKLIQSVVYLSTNYEEIAERISKLSDPQLRWSAAEALTWQDSIDPSLLPELEVILSNKKGGDQ